MLIPSKQREQAALEAFDAAKNLLAENQQILYQAQRSNIPSSKVNLECPLLDDCPTFEQYAKLVTMWSKTTDIPKHKLGTVLAFSIPVNSTKYGDDLREDLFNNVDSETLTNNDEGVQMVMDYLKTRVGRNEREAQIETFVAFLKYQRRQGQAIKEYILEFERHYKKCKVLDILFNDNVSAFLLLYNANLNEVEYKLVKGVMNIAEDKGKLYIKTKAKLSEMLSNSIGEVVSSQGNIGNDLLLTQHSLNPQNINQSIQDVLVAQGWKPPHRQNKYQKGRMQSTKTRYSNPQKAKFNQAHNPPTTNPPTSSKSTNPLGPDGEPMKCHSCGSFRHLIGDCPHSYENNTKAGKKFIKKEVYYTMVDETEQESTDDSSDDNNQEQGRQIYQNDATKIVMFTDNKIEISRFTNECLNQGALDTCCTSCVCGKEWLDIYLKALTPELKQMVQGPLPSEKQFMFGNQGKLKSSATYKIPIKVGGKLKMLEIDAIQSDIPLLISMTAMKEMGMILDLKNDRITVDDIPIPVTRTSAGHYAIDLINEDQISIDQVFMINANKDHESVNLVDLTTADEKTQYKLLDKIHKQFGHRPKPLFVNLLKSCEKWQEKFSPMLDKIIARCEGCIMRKRAPDKPAVAMPLATDFNQVVTMDLKIWDKNKHQYILYLIDAFTRYTVATVITRKTPDQVINAIFEKWIQYFGTMDKILTDNGGEFSNAEMLEVSNKINLKLFTTGAESPWQNGLCEKNHAHTDNILQSVLRDFPNLSLKAALTWACTAKNSLTTIHGYCPFQLVFGRNIKLPNVLNDPPPTYEIKTKSKALADNLTAIHATRQAYMKSENCERLKKALRSKIRTFEHTYEHGDYVYYKRDRQDGWEGPAKVVFQDNKVILVRHGGFFYKVSANRLLPAHNDITEQIKKDQVIDYILKPKEDTPNNSNPPTNTDTPPNITKKPPRITITESDDTIINNDQEPLQENTNNQAPLQEDTNDQAHQQEQNEDQEPQHDQINDQEQHTPSQQEEQISKHEDQPIENNANTPVETENITENNTVSDNTSEHENHSEDDDIPNEPNAKTKPMQRITKPINSKSKTRTAKNTIANNTISIKLRNKDRIEIKEGNRWERGIVLRKAGKATGKYPTWYNFKLDNGKEFSADIKQREIRKLSNEEAMTTWVTNEVLAVMVPRADRNSEQCMEAKQQELQKLKEFNTYKVVEDQNQDRITTTWVLTEKADTIRARLTCKGFQEEDDFPTDSPTIQKSSIRLLLTLATTFGWTIQTIDIKSAFLQGDKLTRTVFVKPPKESNLKNKLWKLNKCLYGLKDASRQWYLRLKKTLEANGFKKCIYDGGLFFLVDKNNNIKGMVGVHVDDFLSAGVVDFMINIVPKVLEAFIIGKTENQSFAYTGFKLSQDNTGILLDQTEYVQNLEILDLDTNRLRAKGVEMNQNELTYLRHYAGALNWAVGITRPDLSFDMISLSTHFKGGNVSALKQAHSVVKVLKKMPAYIRISNLGDTNNCELWVFSDAAHRNLNNNTDSAGGYIIFMVNTKNGNCSPIEWRANKIKRKVSSTLAAEMLALSNALEAAIGTRDQIYEISAGKIHLKIKAITDNKSARDTIYSEKANDQKRLRAEIAAIKEMVDKQEIEEVRWVAGQHMLADILTKKGVKRHGLMSVLQSGKMGQELLKVCSA